MSQSLVTVKQVEQKTGWIFSDEKNTSPPTRQFVIDELVRIEAFTYGCLNQGGHKTPLFLKSNKISYGIVQKKILDLMAAIVTRDRYRKSEDPPFGIFADVRADIKAFDDWCQKIIDMQEFLPDTEKLPGHAKIRARASIRANCGKNHGKKQFRACDSW